ncbi:hypothetical protein B0H14DRAFT_2171639, partial [Mycena olivaceomarginata]
DIKSGLPIWFHIGADKKLNKLNNSDCAKCLRNNHKVVTVGDMVQVAASTHTMHKRRCNCACPPCRADRNQGCLNPYKCRDEALKILDCLNEKWDPRREVIKRNDDLTDDEIQANKVAIQNRKPALFNTAITLKTNIANAFRLF